MGKVVREIKWAQRLNGPVERCTMCQVYVCIREYLSVVEDFISKFKEKSPRESTARLRSHVRN